MCKSFIKDRFFKELFNRYFGSGVNEDSLEKIEKLITSYDSELVYSTLNIIKASVISETPFIESYKLIRQHIDTRTESSEVSDKFILSLTLKYLVTMDSNGIETLISTKKDFIKEVIADKLKIKISEVTDDMKTEELTNSDGVYSIEEPSLNSWDEYFFNMAVQSARNSKCLSRNVGAVLVKDKSILGTGYNGPPRGVPRCDLRWSIDKKFMEKYKTDDTLSQDFYCNKCPRKVLGAGSGEMLDLCIAAHAEENAIVNAARMGIKVKGATLYVSCAIPCFKCIIKIINAGISELVVTGIQFYDDNSEFLINNSDLKVRIYNFKK